jgi:hypothetical protein
MIVVGERHLTLGNHAHPNPDPSTRIYPPTTNLTPDQRPRCRSCPPPSRGSRDGDAREAALALEIGKKGEHELLEGFGELVASERS